MISKPSHTARREPRAVNAEMASRKGSHANGGSYRHAIAKSATAVGLAIIGGIGLANSWGSLYTAAAKHMTGTGLPVVTIGVWTFSTAGASLPLLLDLLILIASARYVIGVREERPVGGWRAAAHAAIAGTVIMNALSAQRLSDVPWHIIAPAVLSIVIELVAREILGTLREVDVARGDIIPLRLWITCPAESARVAWRMARTGQRSADQVRQQTERCAAVRDDLRLAIPGIRRHRDRARILRRLWSGALDPDTLVGLIVTNAADHQELVRACLRTVARLPLPPSLEAENARREAGETEAETPRQEATPPGKETASLCEARGELTPTTQAGDEARSLEAGSDAHRARPSRKITLDEIDKALRDGDLATISREPIKKLLNVSSNTADRLIREYRDREQQAKALRVIR